MKRSEALYAIYDILWNHVDECNLNKQSYELLAEDLLRVLENEGMRPTPYRNKQNSVSYDWEPENEN